MEQESEHLPEQQCPHCKHKLDAATSATGETCTPTPGCLTICAYCSRVLIFEAGLTVRPATREDLDTLPPDVRAMVARAVLVTRHFINERAREN
jgi:hypothetical protein